MASEDWPASGGTAAEETAVAARKKQLRRVSFAEQEITSVHFFKRDEDYSDNTPPFDGSGGESPTVAEGLGLFRDLGDRSDDSSERRGNEEDEEGPVRRGSFFRPIESLSPGSSTVGSGLSNDEDDFFGPVSARFIRPGRLSDSAASDDNHEITMDSTSFSMHFRSLAMSESGDLKTPTRVGLGFEDKTPTQNAGEDGSLMVLTNARKLSQQSSSVPLDNFTSGGKDSNNMSLIGENSSEYDYGRLSPSLDALLAAGNKALPYASPSHLAELKSPCALGTGRSSQKDLMNFGDEEIGRGAHVTNKANSTDNAEVSEADNYSEVTPNKQVINDISNRNDEAIIMPKIKSFSTPEQLVKVNHLSATEVKLDGVNGFSSITKGTKGNNDGRLFDSDAVALHGSPYSRSSQEHPRGNYLRNGSQRVAESERMIESPLAGSISSISAKRHEMFTNATTSPAGFSILTPLPAHSPLSTSKESAKLGLSLSSVQNSTSKFRSLDTSPATSASKNGIEKLKLKISNHLFTTSPRNTAHFESSIEIRSRGVCTPVPGLEQFYHHPKEVNDRIVFSNSNGNPSPNGIDAVSMLGENREITVADVPEEPPVDLSANILSNNDFNKDVPLTISSPNEVSRSVPISDKEIELLASACGSPLVNAEVDVRKDVEADHTYPGLLISPVRRAYQKPSLEKVYQRDASAELNQQPQQQQLNNHLDNETNNISRKNVYSTGFSTPDTAKLLSSSYVVRAEDPKSSDLFPASTHNELSRENNTASFKGNWSGLVRDVPKLSASAGLRGREYKSPSKKTPLKEPAQSPSTTKLAGSPFSRELPNSVPADAVQFLPEEEIASSPSKSNFSGLVNCQDSYSERPLPVDNCEEYSGRKRSSEEAVLSDVCHMSKVARTKKSFEVEKSDRRDTSYIDLSDKKEQPESDVPLRDWKDVLSKLLQDTEKMLSPLHDQLDLRGIAMLEETLIYLQKARNYDILNSEIQSQRFPAQFGIASHKRSAETLVLLQKLVYEKARLQLSLVRQNRLQKFAQHLRSGVEDSQNLRQIFLESVSPSVRGSQSDRDCNHKNKASNAVIASLQKESNVLDEQVGSLRKLLLGYLETKGEQICNYDLKSIEGSLKKRMLLRLVRQHLQPWKIADFGSSDNHKYVSLNYVGFICQSISLTANSAPNFTVSSKLHNQMIIRTFPNMEACEAFAYVFRSEAAEEIVNSRSLALKTQAVEFLLRNLLEVVGEVQQARIEIENLICSKFSSPSEGKLDLLLSFLDNKTSQKVTMSLGMSCLDRGIYPSEVLPSNIVCTNGMPQSLATEITAAVRTLPIGYQRVMRFCRCVSRLVQSSSN